MRDAFRLVRHLQDQGRMAQAVEEEPIGPHTAHQALLVLRRIRSQLAAGGTAPQLMGGSIPATLSPNSVASGKSTPSASLAVPTGMAQAAGWEFGPGFFVYEGQQYSLKGMRLRLLRAFVESHWKSLTKQEIKARVNDAAVADSRVDGMISELRKSLRQLLPLPDNYNPLPTCDVGAWRLALPPDADG
jgi:hypothetical protein